MKIDEKLLRMFYAELLRENLSDYKTMYIFMFCLHFNISETNITAKRLILFIICSHLNNVFVFGYIVWVCVCGVFLLLVPFCSSVFQDLYSQPSVFSLQL